MSVDGLEILGPEAQAHLAGAHPSRNTIGGAMIFERPDELSTYELVGRIKRRIASALDLVPRLTKVAVPVSGKRPAHVLVDGPPVDLEAHVQLNAADEVVSRERMEELLTLFMDQPMDLDRPLWRMMILPRVEGGEAAVAFRVHHFVQDGVLGIAAGAVLLIDDKPDAELRVPAQYEQGPPPTDAQLDAAREEILKAHRAEIRELLGQLGRNPGEAVRRGRHIASTYEEELAGRRSKLLSRRSDQRGLEIVQMPFAEVKACQNVLGSHVSINDVAVTLVVRGVARMLGAERCAGEIIRVDVPVTLALQEGDPSADDFDKRAAAMVLTLPLDEEDPRELLRIVNEQSSKRKTTGARDISELMHVLSLLPGPLSTRASARLWASGNMLFSNIPGPQQDLYVAGNRVTSVFGMGNLRGESSLRVVTLSFGDQVSFGIVYDRSAEGIDRLAAGIRETLTELGSSA